MQGRYNLSYITRLVHLESMNEELFFGFCYRSEKAAGGGSWELPCQKTKTSVGMKGWKAEIKKPFDSIKLWNIVH